MPAEKCPFAAGILGLALISNQSLIESSYTARVNIFQQQRISTRYCVQDSERGPVKGRCRTFKENIDA
jgi:hypothetical protein